MLEGEQSSGGPQSQHLMLLANQGDATLADFTRVAAITQLHENHLVVQHALQGSASASGPGLRGAAASSNQLHSQLFGTFTEDRSRAAVDERPSSLRVRSRSARNISMARTMPASPAAARP